MIIINLYVILSISFYRFLIYKSFNQGCEELQVYIPEKWIKAFNQPIAPSVDSVLEQIREDKETHNRLYIRGAW